MFFCNFFNKHKYHNTSADSLTGIYAKYCPRIISGIDDFLSNVLNEDIYVTGVSDAIVEYDTIKIAKIFINNVFL